MISICIPIYNFNVSLLVEELSRQAQQYKEEIEIILIDDCSSEEFKSIHRISCKNHQYIELNQNIGRARIRNLFLDYALYNYLLFLDCDSIITTNDFLLKYINTIKSSKMEVICGGAIYPKDSPSRSKMLRWKYGVIKESQDAKTRNIKPNRSFMTNNFLIEKQILSTIRFNEGLKEYGHEDTLFGFELDKKGVIINHIENPILHGEIDNNKVFLLKTEKAILNLIIISNTESKTITSEVKLLSYYSKLSEKHFEKCYLESISKVMSLYRKLYQCDLLNMPIFYKSYP